MGYDVYKSNMKLNGMCVTKNFVIIFRTFLFRRVSSHWYFRAKLQQVFLNHEGIFF